MPGMTDRLLHHLNPAQLQAVSAEPGHHLILAGAGSGKTRVLVHRIAWLIEQNIAAPHQILAVTFTNKAAREMQERINDLLGRSTHGLWMGTFHGLSHRFLRHHWREADLEEHFQIIDSDDQARIVRRLLKANELDDKRWPPKQVQWFINTNKENMLRADQIASDDSHFQNTMIDLYRQYETLCQRSGLIDFTELLLRTVDVLRQNTELREHYQQRFQHVLVDEFQDTNTLQYHWLRLFCGADSFAMVVGDDDQSIYSWRGAKIENIHQFQQDFSPCTLIRLEQNYRSTSVILQAANALIAHNENRLGKELWTQSDTGEPIYVYSAFNEREEASFIIDTIKQHLNQGKSPNDIAIVYRANALSRILEETLLANQLPYRVYGGQKFFDRAEIKDALAYLRIISNPQDDSAFERIINVPTRGIGQVTLNTLRAHARDSQQSLWQAGKDLLTQSTLSGRAANALQTFYHLIEDINHTSTGLSLGEQTAHILQASGLLAHYKKDRSEQGLSRVENLEELQHATGEFTPNTDDDITLTPLAEFLAAVALETDHNTNNAPPNAISLMTLHSAKGLEFPVVFICGCEEGLFPHQMSMEERGIEEERRLCYVGMTRAQEKLFLTYAESRYQHGREQYNPPSRFLREIPSECCEIIRLTRTQRAKPAGRFSKPAKAAAIDDDFSQEYSEFRIGQRVSHPSFGSGVLCRAEGQGAQARVQVKFDHHGSKWLVMRYAKLMID